jgi:hypothetical protein
LACKSFAGENRRQAQRWIRSLKKTLQAITGGAAKTPIFKTDF